MQTDAEDREQDIPDWRKLFAEGLEERESGSSGIACETIPKTPPPQIRARPSNKSGEKHCLFSQFPKDSNCGTRALHVEGILEVEKTGYHKLQISGIQLERITKCSTKKDESRLDHRYAVVVQDSVSHVNPLNFNNLKQN